MSGRIIQTIFGKEWRFPEFGPLPTPWSFNSVLEMSWHLWVCRSVQSLSRIRLFATPWTAACQASLSFTIFWSLLKLMSIESMMPSDHFILCCPLLLLPSIFSSNFVKSFHLYIQWPKYWSFSFSISPSNEYLGLISFRIDWFDLLAVQGTP